VVHDDADGEAEARGQEERDLQASTALLAGSADMSGVILPNSRGSSVSVQRPSMLSTPPTSGQ
jgi:hypothetical protein